MEEQTIARISICRNGLGIYGYTRNQENVKPPWREMQNETIMNEMQE